MKTSLNNMENKKTAQKESSALKKRSWKWTELFSIILTNEENSFAVSLKKLALKKSSNNEVFQHIKKLFDGALKEKEFK